MSQILQPNPELQEIKNKVELLKPMGGIVLSPELQKLRSLVLDSHADVESQFEVLIAKKVFVHATPTRQGLKKTYPDVFEKIQTILRGTTWVKKALTVYTLEIIDSELFKKLTLLNDLRNEFAHIRSGKIQMYEDEERQLFAYQLIFDCLTGLAKEDQFFGF